MLTRFKPQQTTGGEQRSSTPAISFDYSTNDLAPVSLHARGLLLTVLVLAQTRRTIAVDSLALRENLHPKRCLCLLDELAQSGLIERSQEGYRVQDLLIGSYSAPQPGSGFIYAITRQDAAIKIGRSVDVRARLAGIKGSPDVCRGAVKLLGYTHVHNMELEEAKAHAHFFHSRVKGEWFSASWDEVKSYLSNVGQDFQDLARRLA